MEGHGLVLVLSEDKEPPSSLSFEHSAPNIWGIYMYSLSKIPNGIASSLVLSVGLKANLALCKAMLDLVKNTHKYINLKYHFQETSPEEETSDADYRSP